MLAGALTSEYLCTDVQTVVKYLCALRPIKVWNIIYDR